MKYKILLIILGALLVIGIGIGYKLISFMKKMEVNTVSPQCSVNISDSKRDNFFLSEYKVNGVSTEDGVVWIEYVWKNSIIDKELTKEKFEGYQLILKKSVLNRKGFTEDSFLKRWILSLTNNQLPGSGSGNGNYVIYLAKNEMPQKLVLHVVSVNDTVNKKNILDSLVLYKNQHSHSVYFKKEKIDCDFINSGNNNYYKIQFVKERKPVLPCTYFFEFKSYSENEKIRMIEELLMYEGDTSYCAVQVHCYNPARSQTVPEGIEYYSTQVEALFIINHIIFSDPYSYSSYPMLQDKGAKNIETIGGELIKKAFALYKNWLEKAKKEGLSKTIQKKNLPLDDKSSVFWY